MIDSWTQFASIRFDNSRALSVGRKPKLRALGITALGWVLGTRLAFAAGPPLAYTLDLREAATHFVKVAMTISDAGPETQIQFPAWNNLYQVRDFVRNVQDVGARCDGHAVALVRIDLNTWRSGRESCSPIEVRYAVYARDDSIFSSAVDDQHAFLNLAQVLFYLPLERERSATLKFALPGGWRLATTLDDGNAHGEFKAANYDVIADSPVEAGDFQEYGYAQNGATYRVIVRGDPAAYSADRLLESLKKITATETALMREVPFSRYTFIFHFSEGRGGGGMEHRYGTAISARADGLREHWTSLEATAAHEFFHLWNVKRIRPQALEPIDYTHGNDTRDLWFSEGVTSTYEELALLRAGLIDRRTFYGRLAGEIRELEERPARHFQSAALSGCEAWLEKYSDYFRPERSISYYNKGALLGFLLDLGIRQGSGNQHNLDDLMRRLNEDFAHRGRFFTDADLRAAISDLAPGFHAQSFFSDYVSGTRDLDYNTYLGFAGLRLVSGTREGPSLGFLAVRSFDGPIYVESVEPGSNAASSGIERGDLLLKMNGRPLLRLPEDQLVGMKPGQKIKFQVRRGNRALKVEYRLGTKQEITYRIEELQDSSPEQLRLRESWLAVSTEP